MSISCPRTLPLSTLALGAVALACFGGGAVLAAGVGRDWHPLLAQSDADLALIISGIALALSAAFPLVLRRLAAADTPGQ